MVGRLWPVARCPLSCLFPLLNSMWEKTRWQHSSLRINTRWSLTSYCDRQNALNLGKTGLIQSQAAVPVRRTCSSIGSSPRVTVSSGNIYLLLHGLPKGCRGISALALTAPPPPPPTWVFTGSSLPHSSVLSSILPFLKYTFPEVPLASLTGAAVPCPRATAEPAGTNWNWVCPAPASAQRPPQPQPTTPQTHTPLAEVQIIPIIMVVHSRDTAVCLITSRTQSHSK